MKLKYYLRGLGIGIIITTIILTIAYSGRKSELTDEEIIQRAEELGMVMEEDSLFPFGNKQPDTEGDSKTDTATELTVDTETEQETESDKATEAERDSETETDSKINSENETKTNAETYRLTIFPGSVAQNISNELEENGVIDDGYSFRQYLAEVGYTTLLNVGEYDIPYGASYEEIYDILKEGPL